MQKSFAFCFCKISSCSFVTINTSLFRQAIYRKKRRNGYFQQMIITMCRAQEAIHPSSVVPVSLTANTFYRNVPTPRNKKEKNVTI